MWRSVSVASVKVSSQLLTSCAINICDSSLVTDIFVENKLHFLLSCNHNWPVPLCVLCV